MSAKPTDIVFVSEFKKLLPDGDFALYGKWGGNPKTIEVSRCHTRDCAPTRGSCILQCIQCNTRITTVLARMCTI